MTVALMFPILRATLEDGEEILALQKLAFASEAKLYGEENVQPLWQTLLSMQEDIQNQVVLKAMSDERMKGPHMAAPRIVGSVRARLSGDTCEVSRLVTHPDFQRRGIGTALMRAIETHFPEARCFELFTGEKSTSNIRLYECLGYKRTHTRALSPSLTFVYMRKIQRPE